MKSGDERARQKRILQCQRGGRIRKLQGKDS